MNDRELLELAAKAAGIDAEWFPSCSGLLVRGSTVAEGGLWNPLNNDGQALRLAVKLRFEIVPVDNGYIDVCLPSSKPFACACEGGKDPYAATRRAIVRAAAEIGRLNGST